MFVELAGEMFKEIPSVQHTPKVDTKYYGGSFFEKEQIKCKVTFEDNVLIQLGFPTNGYNDKDFVTYSIIESFLGGGFAFSAGGPGKGMYSYLYRVN